MPHPLCSSICAAIAAKQLVRFWYHDKTRTVEPHVVGLSVTNRDVLIGWYHATAGDQKPSGWRQYYLDEIDRVEVLDEHFGGPRLGFNPLHDMERVDCSLSVIRVLDTGGGKRRNP